ncbi:MAG TPA: universal stress protein [Thermovirgaceae bacterium]|nr:universal stress protein [Thermovirgaceae bacterium]
MFRKILFPTDFSELSHKGLLWTAANVADGSSEIVLVHVVEPMTGLDTSRMIQEAEKAMEKTVSELGTTGIKCSSLVLSGDPLETLSETAHSRGCSVSVLFAESNDVVVNFIRYMAIPHLVVKTSETKVPFQNPFNHVAVCTDLSPERTDRVLEELRNLLDGRNVPMTIIHSVSLDDPSTSSDMFQIASSALEEVRESVASWNSDVKAEVLAGEPEIEILRKTREMTPGMLVVGLSTHGQLWELIIGSTGEAIIEKSPCPVLVIPT